MADIIDVDHYIQQIGDFGWYQAKVYGITLVIVFVAGMIAVPNVFLLGIPRHR